jgi:beta-glucosidase
MNDSKSKRDQLPLIAGSLHKQVARECVRRSMVLLKNDALNGTKPLPINVNSNVHIIGDFADNMWMQIGGWALDWPSAFFHNPPTPPPAGTTLRAAITAACKGTVTYSANATGIPASANVIVVCVGEQPYAESGGDAPASQPYTLTQAHKDLITQAAASGKPVVVVMYSGRPLIITDDIAKCQAWLQAWLPGTEGGGIADILFSINGEKPTGKLTHTWPATYAQIPINTGNVSGQQYGDFVGSGGTPLFAYHFGLTY